MIHAMTLAALANALAVEQAADCITSHRATVLGIPEQDPIAKAAGASRSLPLCFIEAGAINVGLRLTKNQSLLRIAVFAEGAVVAGNVGVLLSWKTR